MSANTTRKVRFGDDKSSRASTVGGSSTSSSHSGSYPDQYTDARYNIAALQDSLNKTIQEHDAWREEALTKKEEAQAYKEEASSAKARVTALKNSVATLENDRKDLERQIKELKQQFGTLQDENDKLKKENKSLKKKVRDQDAHQSDAPSSPDSANAKLRRSGSKKSKQVDADELDKDRLKERFDRSPPSSTISGSTHSKPPSSSKGPSRHRRTSISSSSTERPSSLYVEPYGSGAPRAMPSSPVVPTSSRRTSQYPPDYHMQEPAYPPVPRTVGMQRGTVEVPLYEDGNYHFHPLPDQRRPY